jgi:hypothetical protein
MRCSIAIWLLAAAASASVTLGPAKRFADPPAQSYGLYALIPRATGVSAFYLGYDNTLYVERLGNVIGRAVLTNVDRVIISNSMVAFEAAGTIFMAPLRDDDSVIFFNARVIANGKLQAFACNANRCLAQWTEGTAYRTQIVGGPSLALDSFASVLATDPNGFLVYTGGKLHRFSNDGADTPIATPELLGKAAAADFDGARYTVVGTGDRTIAIAAVDLVGTVSRLSLLVDQRDEKLYPYTMYGVQMAWSGTEHLVVAYWSRDFVVSHSFAWPVYANGYRLDRELQGLRYVSFGGTSASPAEVVFAGDRFWVLWYDLPVVLLDPFRPMHFLVGETLSADGTITPIKVLPPPAGESLVAVAASDAHMVGVWSEQLTITHRYRVRAQADGEASPILVGESAFLSAAAANVGDTFLVAMERDDGIEGLQRANGSWTRVDLSALGKGGNVAVAANDSTFLVATTDRGRLVATPGRTDLGAADEGSAIAAASDGNGFALLSARNGSTALTILDAMENVIAVRDLGPAASSFVIGWSGSDYVAIGMFGTTARTWRLSRYGDVVQTFDTERGDAEPISIARAGEVVVATWYSPKGGFATTLAPLHSAWSAPVTIERAAAVPRGNDALLFGWSYSLGYHAVLATRTLHVGLRTRAVR